MRALFLISLVLLTACSRQERDADLGIGSAEVLKYLGEVNAANAAGSDLQAVKDMQNAEGVAIYYADAGPSGPNGEIFGLGTVASILSLYSLNFLGSEYASLGWYSFTHVRVFYFDVPKATGRDAGLIIGLMKSGDSAYTYHALKGEASLDGDYQVVLKQNGTPRLTLYSNDVVDGDLAPTIQMKAYEVINGAESYIGKFSTLVGFGP